MMMVITYSTQLIVATYMYVYKIHGNKTWIVFIPMLVIIHIKHILHIYNTTCKTRDNMRCSIKHYPTLKPVKPCFLRYMMYKVKPGKLGTLYITVVLIKADLLIYINNSY